jgi:hypothetical protein
MQQMVWYPVERVGEEGELCVLLELRRCEYVRLVRVEAVRVFSRSGVWSESAECRDRDNIGKRKLGRM